MKKLIFILLISMAVAVAHSQNCPGPLSSIVFQQKYSQLSSVRNDQQRLTRANEFVEANCLLTHQTKQIAELFNDEVTRLIFVQNAYATTYDKENFYDVYDVFAYFSTVMRLHDYILDFNKTGRRPARNYPVPEPVYNFPNYNYPSYKNYREATRCSEPVSDETFFRLLRNIMNQPDDELRVSIAVQLAEGNCLTVEQIMKIGSMIEQEQKRLDYLKRSYDYSYDVGNYQFGDQLFTTATYRDEFSNYIRSRKPGSPGQHMPQHHVPPCGVSDGEFSEIVRSISSQSFNNTQLTLAKQIVKSKKCFTTEQIRQIVNIFSFETSKLDMAKYCYTYCVDRDNYYRINECFSFSSSVTELDEFISTQR